MKTIVVASDSFKGSLTSDEVAGYIRSGIRKVFPECNVKCVSVADGGEGTAAAVIKSLGGTFVDVDTEDPLGRQIVAQYGLYEDNGSLAAVIEMAAASGLTLLGERERNPLETSTYGTGLLVKDALLRGCRKLLMCIGGSATNDGGTGMLAALGFRFLDADGQSLPGKGSSLGKIASIDDSRVLPEAFDADFLLACDVSAPFCGPEGAAYVFASQKGADVAMTRILDNGLRSFANIILSHCGTDVSCMRGAGAAGGLGGGILAFLHARLVSGAEMVLDAVGFDEIIEGCDMVITGEGKIDMQTAMGKLPEAVRNRASEKNIPVAAIAGCVDVPEEAGTMGFAAILPIISAPMPLDYAMRPDVAGKNIVRTVCQIMSLIKSGEGCNTKIC